MNNTLAIQRNYSIEFLRYAFTCLIALLHFEISVYGEQIYFESGFVAVEFFFILSGFFICKGYLKTRETLADATPPHVLAWSYTKKRFLQIAPFFYTAFALLFIFKNFIYGRTSLFVALKELYNNFWELSFLGSLGFSWEIINGPTWYLSALLIAGYFVYTTNARVNKL